MINGANPASFDPDVFGIDPGQPLKAQIGDLVCWNNQTGDPHQIEVKKKDGTASFTTKELAKFMSSSPGYVAQSGDNNNGTIDYICTKHTGESGKITVVTS
jgi:plastocyanin